MNMAPIHRLPASNAFSDGELLNDYGTTEISYTDEHDASEVFSFRNVHKIVQKSSTMRALYRRRR